MNIGEYAVEQGITLQEAFELAWRTMWPRNQYPTELMSDVRDFDRLKAEPQPRYVRDFLDRERR